MEKGKKTMVIGASTNTERYSYRCIHQLKAHGHPVEALGIKQGEVAGFSIQNKLVEIANVDTVTLYVGPSNQSDYQDYILNVIRPNRLIFNPGTENPAFMNKAIEQGLDAFEACTLGMMSTAQF